MEHISNFKMLLRLCINSSCSSHRNFIFSQRCFFCCCCFFFCTKKMSVSQHKTQFQPNTSKHNSSLTGTVICISVRFAPLACASTLTTNPFTVEQSNRICMRQRVYTRRTDTFMIKQTNRHSGLNENRSGIFRNALVTCVKRNSRICET